MKRTDARPERTNRDELPIFEHRRIRCDECGSLKFKSGWRSVRDGDGVSTQIRECAECGFKFVLLVS